MQLQWMQWIHTDSDAFDAVDLVGHGLDGHGGPWKWQELSWTASLLPNLFFSLFVPNSGPPPLLLT